MHILLYFIIGIISMAAGVAVIVDRILKKKECYEGYIELSIIKYYNLIVLNL